MHHVSRARSLVVLSAGVLLGCSEDFDESQHVKHDRLQDLPALGLVGKVWVEDGAAKGFSLVFGAPMFDIGEPRFPVYEDPDCPVVSGIAGTLDGHALVAYAGGADEQEGFGTTEVVCQPPSFSLAQTSIDGAPELLADGEHEIEIWDASARAKLRFTLLSGKRSLVIDEPRSGVVSIGDAITLRVSPASKQAEAFFTFVDASGVEQFRRDTSDDGVSWIDDSRIRLVIPDAAYTGATVTAGKGTLEVTLEGWDAPAVSVCDGADFCQVTFEGPQAPADTASVDLELRD
jgi:hypothetical protein